MRNKLRNLLIWLIWLLISFINLLSITVGLIFTLALFFSLIWAFWDSWIFLRHINFFIFTRFLFGKLFVLLTFLMSGVTIVNSLTLPSRFKYLGSFFELQLSWPEFQFFSGRLFIILVRIMKCVKSYSLQVLPWCSSFWNNDLFFFLLFLNILLDTNFFFHLNVIRSDNNFGNNLIFSYSNFFFNFFNNYFFLNRLNLKLGLWKQKFFIRINYRRLYLSSYLSNFFLFILSFYCFIFRRE